MIKCNDLYDYGYKIYQETDYFKFSIDSIILAEAVKLNNSYKVLDMCTGNAPVPMILCTKNKTIQIDAVEIQKEVFDLAKRSIELNKLDNQITLHNADIKEIAFDYRFDIITCNPPYFKVGEYSKLNDNKVKTIARHEVLIDLDEVIEVAKKNIKENGTFYIVHRTDRLIDVITKLKNANFGIRKLNLIITKNTEKPEFFVLEASKYKKDDLKVNVRNISKLDTYKNLFKEV